MGAHAARIDAHAPHLTPPRSARTRHRPSAAAPDMGAAARGASSDFEALEPGQGCAQDRLGDTLSRGRPFGACGTTSTCQHHLPIMVCRSRGCPPAQTCVSRYQLQQLPGSSKDAACRKLCVVDWIIGHRVSASAAPSERSDLASLSAAPVVHAGRARSARPFTAGKARVLMGDRRDQWSTRPTHPRHPCRPHARRLWCAVLDVGASAHVLPWPAPRCQQW